jgi:hypothetical protein
MESFVTTVVLHDDVVPRLTLTSIRGLVKHLLHIRETWVQIHLEGRFDGTHRAEQKILFGLHVGEVDLHCADASGFCRKHLKYGTKKLLSGQGDIVLRQTTSCHSDTDPSANSSSVGAIG